MKSEMCYLITDRYRLQFITSYLVIYQPTNEY